MLVGVPHLLSLLQLLSFALFSVHPLLLFLLLLLVLRCCCCCDWSLLPHHQAPFPHLLPTTLQITNWWSCCWRDWDLTKMTFFKDEWDWIIGWFRWLIELIRPLIIRILISQSHHCVFDLPIFTCSLGYTLIMIMLSCFMTKTALWWFPFVMPGFWSMHVPQKCSIVFLLSAHLLTLITLVVRFFCLPEQGESPLCRSSPQAFLSVKRNDKWQIKSLSRQ